MSSNAIDYNEMNNSNITNPFSNNKRKTNLRTIFHQKDILIKYAIIGLIGIAFIYLAVSVVIKTSQVSKIEKENDTLKVQIQQIEKSSRDIEQQTLPIKQGVSNLKKENNDLKAKQKKLKDQNKKLKKENKSAGDEGLKKLQSQYEKDAQKLKEISDLNNYYRNQIIALTKDLDDKKEQYVTLQRKYDQLTQGGAQSTGMDSEIITEPDDVETLTTLLFTEPVQYELLYRASRDGFSPSAFHKKCDGTTYTVTVVSLKNSLVLCGFTTQSWDGHQFKEDPYARLVNLNYERLYKPRLTNQAIYASPEHFPVFGNGDFLISEDGVLSTVFPNTYGDNDSVQNELLNGRESAGIVELEVFKVHSI